MVHAGVLVKPFKIRVVKLYTASILPSQLGDYFDLPLSPITAFDQMHEIFNFVYKHLFNKTADEVMAALHKRNQKSATGLQQTKALLGNRLWYIAKAWIAETVPPKKFQLSETKVEPFIKMISHLFGTFKTTSNRNSERNNLKNYPGLKDEWDALLTQVLKMRENGLKY